MHFFVGLFIVDQYFLFYMPCSQDLSHYITLLQFFVICCDVLFPLFCTALCWFLCFAAQWLSPFIRIILGTKIGIKGCVEQVTKYLIYTMRIWMHLKVLNILEAFKIGIFLPHLMSLIWQQQICRLIQPKRKCKPDNFGWGGWPQDDI